MKQIDQQPLKNIFSLFNVEKWCWNETITRSCVSHLKRRRGPAVGGKMSGGGLARSQVLEHLCKLRSLKLLDQEPQFPPSEHSLEDWAQVVAHLLQASGWVICAPCLAPAPGNSSVPTCVISGDPPPVSAATLSHLQQAEKLVHLGIWLWGDGSDWNLLKSKLSLYWLNHTLLLSAFTEL